MESINKTKEETADDGIERRKTIPKPFRRQKQSVDHGDGCDPIPENTKLINDGELAENIDKAREDKNDRLADNAHQTFMRETHDKVELNNHSPTGNVPQSVISDDCSTQGNNKRRRIAFSNRNRRSKESREDSEGEGPSYKHEETNDSDSCAPFRCHGTTCGNASFKQMCTRQFV